MIITTFPGGDANSMTIVKIPIVEEDAFAYTGEAQGPTITNLDEQHVTVTGATATEQGTHTVTFALKNKKRMFWTDMTTEDKTYTYTIGPITIQAPTVTVGTYTYNGNEQGPEISNLDEKHVTVTDAAKTDAGTYTLKFALTHPDFMTWSDTGTADDKSFTYTINKAAGTLTLSADSVTLNKEATSATVNVSGYKGTVSVKSGDETVVAAALAGDTVTISSVNSKTGEAAVIVTAAATANYAEISKTITVKADFVYIDTFANTVANGHLTEVAEALQAGTITVDDLPWAVGDEASISHSGTAYTWVIQNKGGKTMATNKECSYIIGMKNCLTNTRKMHSIDMNSGGWKSMDLREYCNGDFRNSLPTDIKNAFKQFENLQADGNGSETQTTTDYFAIPTEKEVFGSNKIANFMAEDTLKQFEWYETSANRIKKSGDSGSACGWWERSPFTSEIQWCCVYRGGTTSYAQATSTYGVSPFGCI